MTEYLEKIAPAVALQGRTSQFVPKTICGGGISLSKESGMKCELKLREGKCKTCGGEMWQSDSEAKYFRKLHCHYCQAKYCKQYRENRRAKDPEWLSRVYKEKYERLGEDEYKRRAREYYHKNKVRLAKYSKEWREKNREKRSRINRINHENTVAKYPERYAARKKLNRKIESGAITRMPCSICGKTNAEGHHEDYSKPYDVIWFCMEHHKEYHLKKRQEERDGVLR